MLTETARSHKTSTIASAVGSHDPERLLSIPDAVAFLGGISEATIRRYLTLGKLRRFKVGGRTFVKRGDLEKLVQES